MKILMLTLYLPYPPTSGGQIRSYNLIKQLSRTHDITLVSIIKKGEEKYASELKKYCREVLYFYRSDKPFTPANLLRYAFSFYPFLVIRNLSLEAKKAIERKLKKEQFDVIHVETFYLSPHVPKTAIPILLVDQTIEYQVYQHFVDTMRWSLLRPLLNVEVVKLKYWEKRFWREADRVVAVSESDRQSMLKLVPEKKIDIIPNAPGDDLADLYGLRPPANLARPVIYFQSNFLWLQNVEGAKILINEVFPKIKSQIPTARCLVVGQNVAGKLDTLTQKDTQIVDLETSDISGIRRAYLAGTVFVAPLWGPGGTRLKLLSAMATGVPVVTTPIGAMGIDVHHEREALIGGSPAELANLTVRLLKDKKLYRRLVVNAKKLIDRKYNWENIARHLSLIYEQTAANK